MLTVIETPTFQRLAAEFWSEEERLEFVSWIAENSEAGDVIKGTGGLRKVRWSRPGMGKRGGARVIYFQPKRARRSGFAGGLRQGQVRQHPRR